MFNTDDYILLGSITLFSFWLAIFPSGFQKLLTTLLQLMNEFGLAPRVRGGYRVRPIFIRAFGVLILAIIGWIIFMALTGTLPEQPR